MAVIVKGMDMPDGCAKCRFFKKHMFGCGIDYSYSCILGAKEFPMPWIRQLNEKACDCPLKSIDGLIESIENTMILMGIPQANRVAIMDRISEYCGLEESNGED